MIYLFNTVYFNYWLSVLSQRGWNVAILFISTRMGYCTVSLPLLVHVTFKLLSFIIKINILLKIILNGLLIQYYIFWISAFISLAVRVKCSNFIDKHKDGLFPLHLLHQIVQRLVHHVRSECYWNCCYLKVIIFPICLSMGYHHADDQASTIKVTSLWSTFAPVVQAVKCWKKNFLHHCGWPRCVYVFERDSTQGTGYLPVKKSAVYTMAICTLGVIYWLLLLLTETVIVTVIVFSIVITQ